MSFNFTQVVIPLQTEALFLSETNETLQPADPSQEDFKYSENPSQSNDEFQKITQLDVKPPKETFNSDVFQECEESECIEQPTDEKRSEISTDLQNLDHIFIPDISEMMDERQDTLERIKHEVPDEIQNIFHSQSLAYTLLYIPTEDGVTLNMQEAPLEDTKNPSLKIEAPTYPEGLSTEEIDSGKCRTDIPDSNIKDNNNFPEPKLIDSSLNSNSPTHNNDDSDSDYFVDPKDNLLGTLNDTILRIKEIKVEGKQLNYQCTLCMQNYDKLTEVLTHTVDNHVPSSGPFYCVVCEKDCESHRDLRTHVKTHTGRYPYICFICDKSYSMKRYLKRHMSCHTDFPRHRCAKCGLRFSVKIELDTHLRTHVHGGAPFECSQCPRVFNHKGNYKRHLISHIDPNGLHLPKYPCEICSKRFLNNRTLETHMRVHTGEKPFQCDVCSRSFSQQGNLFNHLRIHSNPRSYTCEVCGKRFNQRSTLRDHSLLHTGEKPWVCNVCGVAFTFSAALRRHMWTHATDKPFGCEICNARFVGKYDLKRHMKIHTDRPKTKRKRNQSNNKEVNQECTSNEISGDTREPSDDQTIYIEQVFLTEDATEIVPQEESEKENVDALFSFIQYS